jgi:hypothetical protein
LLGTALTFIGLIAGSGGRLPQLDLFPPVEGISEADVRLLDEIKRLGGTAHFMERTPRFLGVFGGRDLLWIGFRGTALDDERLSRFVRSYGDRIWGLALENAGLTDASLRHLANLPHLRDLRLGNVDTHDDPRAPAFPRNRITDAGLVHLRRLTGLHGLNLNGLLVTDLGLDAIKDLPSLGGLYLNRTRVSGPGLGRLKSLPGLAVLYLDESDVTDAGLAHLVGAANLQVLSIVNVPLSGRGLTPLKALPRLDRLDVKGCRLDFEDLDAFLAARPSVKLE